MNSSELLAGLENPPGGGLLVALSGGADSAVAAWAAATLRPGTARALHVHHGTEAADELAAAAEGIANSLGLAFEIVAVSVPSGASWEARARDARWDALFAKAEPADTVVTGHHRDDLAETTLGNLLRGAGAAGLAAMAIPRADIWRPLIEVGRDDVRAIAAELGLPFVDDPTNDDSAFTRNRLRHDVMPLLTEVAPQTAQSLARTARILAADDEVLEIAATAAAITEDAWGGFAVGAALVQTASRPVATRMVRRLLRAANPPYAGSSEDVATVLAVSAGTVAAGEVTGGLRIEREGPLLVLHRGPAPPAAPAELALPGTAQFGPLDVTAAVAARVLVRRTSLLDVAEVGVMVGLRSPTAGDRIEIAAGSKLVLDVLAEAGVPVRVRSAWPLVEAHGRIAAVAGIRSAPWARGQLGDAGTVELTVREMQR